MTGAIRALLVIALIALVTFFTRLLPFVLFPEGKETPPYVRYLGKVLPFAIIAMLVVYCLKGTSLLTWPYGLPELIAVAAVVAALSALLLYLDKKKDDEELEHYLDCSIQ